MGLFQTMPATLVGLTSVALSIWTYLQYSPGQDGSSGMIVFTRSDTPEYRNPASDERRGIRVSIQYHSRISRLKYTVGELVTFSEPEVIRAIQDARQFRNIPVGLALQPGVPWGEIQHLVWLFESHGFNRVEVHASDRPDCDGLSGFWEPLARARR